uniref:Glycosyltransferase n=1 Tax=Catharanthus roseus TaxID=4058 RepID=Q6F4D5_CATRO|nr:UDP-glucose glucosyltransferase [Catharanthus roseus]
MVNQLHIFNFPFMAQGHMLPALDMANLFTSRGVKVTLITTHQHVPMFTKSIERSRNSGFDISIQSIKFPASEVGLPEGIESLDQVSGDDEMLPKFMRGVNLLQQPLEQLLQESRPHCLLSDMFFPWTTESAAKFGIPRLLFHGSCSFALSAAESVRRNKPFENVSTDTEEFVVPDLPHQIKLTRTQISTYERENIESDFTKMLKKVRDSESTSYGVVVNSFYELEPDYADYYINVLGRKAWHIGPFLLCNKLQAEDKAQRGKKSAIDADECLNWLDSKQPNSVIYLCFGSMANLNSAQLHEIATALESSGQNFIWVVRKCVDEENSSKWFPEGFEERTKEKGLIIKGWAPQTLILEHESVGAFVTHCGWNSTLEGICAGVPLVTWPFFAEQFFNEKLITEVLKTGYGVGARQWSRVSTEIIKGEAIANAINRVMVGDEAVEMRNRAKDLKEKARKALEEDGSSYRDLTALIEELGAYRSQVERKQQD